MKLSQIKEVLNAEVITGQKNMEFEIGNAFGADLMSDVLAFVNSDTLLLTGLANTQVIRTAEMSDISVIVFVRGKTPTEEMIEMATGLELTLMRTEDIMYEACGKLYKFGLPGVSIRGAGK